MGSILEKDFLIFFIFTNVKKITVIFLILRFTKKNNRIPQKKKNERREEIKFERS